MNSRPLREEKQRVGEYRIGLSSQMIIPLFRGALRQTLESQFPDASIEEAGALEDVTARLEQDGEADLILLDLTMPGMRGFSGLMYLRAQFSGVPVVVVSANEDPQAIRRAIEFGASGFIPKSHGIDVIREAISAVMSGNVWTPPDVDLKCGRRQRRPGSAPVDADTATGPRPDDVV